ncbi:MAG TPA: hypothetical protein DEF27_03455 [Oscillatoriales bacterium UBA8482]|nr:hypothetical protein [Oscillatoriales bacterium UBA8482]
MEVPLVNVALKILMFQIVKVSVQEISALSLVLALAIDHRLMVFAMVKQFVADLLRLHKTAIIMVFASQARERPLLIVPTARQQLPVRVALAKLLRLALVQHVHKEKAQPALLIHVLQMLIV